MLRVQTRAERGAAAVEFAIVLPVLVALLCGTIDWGYYFFTREIVVNASREGARTGSLQAASADAARAAAEAAARDYLRTASLDAAAAVITTGVDRDGGTCPETSSCVLITYDTGGAVTGFVGSFVPDSIVAYAQMRR